MPIYEYQCQHCQHHFEEMQKFSDPELVSCPKCNEPKLQRLVSVGSFHLKGSDWYRNENRKASNEVAADKSSSE